MASASSVPGRPGNYAEQARTYDLTRGASPTVVRAITRQLGPANGRRLLDVAGGTGNYAQVLAARGFRVTVADASFEMLEHAARKLIAASDDATAGALASPVVQADALVLPFGVHSFDAVTIVNAIHLFADPLAALRESRRVVADGPVVLTAFTAENFASLFVFEYFGLGDEIDRRMSNAELEALLHDAGFMNVVHAPYVYTDTADGSLNALHTNALHLAGPAYLRNTSFWHRLDEPTRLAGVEALARDLRSGVLERRVKEAYTAAAEHGHATVFAAWP